MTDILKSIRDITFLFAIYLYFAGWTYRWYYLDFFGLSLTQSDTGFYYFFVYSFNVLVAALKAWQTWVLLAGILIAWKWSGIHRGKTYYKMAWVILLIILLPFLFYIAKTSAWQDAQRQAAPATSDLRPVQLVLADDFLHSVSSLDTGTNSPSVNMNEFLQLNRTGKLRLLLASKDEVFLLYQQPSAGSVPVIYDLSKDDVRWMALLGH
jgi:hypothetical protein